MTAYLSGFGVKLEQNVFFPELLEELYCAKEVPWLLSTTPDSQCPVERHKNREMSSVA